MRPPARAVMRAYSYEKCRIGDTHFHYDPARPPPVIRVEVVPKTHFVLRVVNEGGLPIERCSMECVVDEHSTVCETLEGSRGATYECSLAPGDRVRVVASRRQFRRCLEFVCDGSPRIERVLTLFGPGVEARRELAPLPRVDEPATVADVPDPGRASEPEPAERLRVTVRDTYGRAVPGCRLGVYRDGEAEPFMAEQRLPFKLIRGPETNDTGVSTENLHGWIEPPAPLLVLLADCGSLDEGPPFARREVTVAVAEQACVEFIVRTRFVVSGVTPGEAGDRAGLRDGDSIETWQGRRPLRARSIPAHWRIDVRVAVDRNGTLVHLVLPAGRRDFCVTRVLAAP